MELKTSFLRAAKTGEDIRARAQIIKPGLRVMFATAELLTVKDDLVATATCTCLIVQSTN
jgi:acyl-coenzyme A thioesterase PaaI-like protein